MLGLGHRKRIWPLAGVTLLAVALLMGLGSAPQSAAADYRFKVLHFFCANAEEGCRDGSQPNGTLIMDGTGSLYGVTEFGPGAPGGTVFELTPDKTRASGWEETVLYRFCLNRHPCTDGFAPNGGLLIDSAGNLYGVDAGNRASNCLFGIPHCSGAVFELTSNADRTAWAETVLHNFCAHGRRCSDGESPNGGLIMDAAGNLYGTTSAGGGARNAGVVFELTPNVDGTAWTKIVLHRFCAETNCADGQNPHAGLMMGTTGKLYGTTWNGGNGEGVVFELTPNADRTAWRETVLYSFCPSGGSCTDGQAPNGLIMDAAGNLYGTTSAGGVLNAGVVFELTPNVDGTAWTEIVLHRFCPRSRAVCIDGAEPNSLIMDSAGNLYGTTSAGGGGSQPGVVFELTPNADLTASTEEVLHRFCAEKKCRDGEFPNGLIMDGSGNLYGTTFAGGIGNKGVAFELLKSP
jgi:uncharacterized repeat protein (TIGR03803 family)